MNTKTAPVKKLFPILLAVLLLSACFTVFAAVDVSKGRDATVLISTTIPNDAGTYDFIYSTAFFVSPEYLLTTYDSISELDRVKAGKLEVIYDRNTVQEAAIAAVDNRKNLAVLKIPAPTTVRTPLTLNFKSAIDPGEMLYALTYEDCESGDLNTMLQSVTVKNGIVSRLAVETASGRQILQLDFFSRDASPILNAKGEVVGMASGELTRTNDAVCSAINISEAASLLAEFGVGQENFFSKNLMLIIIVAAGALVVAAIVVVAIIFSRKKKEEAKQQKAMADAAASAIQANQQRAARTPMLYCMSGEHNGLKMNLQGQKIFFGRDVATCRVAFKPGTPGISSVHCQVYYDDIKGQFILIDQKSTYGTFLSSGQQLAANVPYNLNAKDSFYLGEKDNMFFVDFAN